MRNRVKPLTREQKKALKVFIETTRALEGETDYQVIADYMNVVGTKDNPIPITLVTRSLPTVQELLALAQAAGSFEADMVAVNKAAELIKSGVVIANHLQLRSEPSVDNVVNLLKSFGVSPAFSQAVESRLVEQIEDPTYRPRIKTESRASRIGIDITLYPVHIQSALNN